MARLASRLLGDHFSSLERTKARDESCDGPIKDHRVVETCARKAGNRGAIGATLGLQRSVALAGKSWCDRQR